MPKTKASKTLARRRGRRLRLLREALGLSNSKVVAQSREVVRKLGGGDYLALTPSLLCHIEAGRNQLTKDSLRAVLGGVYEISRDELAAYVGGEVELHSLLCARAERLGLPQPVQVATSKKRGIGMVPSASAGQLGIHQHGHDAASRREVQAPPCGDLRTGATDLRGRSGPATAEAAR